MGGGLRQALAELAHPRGVPLFWDNNQIDGLTHPIDPEMFQGVTVPMATPSEPIGEKKTPASAATDARAIDLSHARKRLSPAYHMMGSLAKPSVPPIIARHWWREAAELTAVSSAIPLNYEVAA